MMQFPSGSQEIFPIPPCGRHEPWTQKEGILTTSPLNPLPPSSGSVSGGFVITTQEQAEFTAPGLNVVAQGLRL